MEYSVYSSTSEYLESMMCLLRQLDNKAIEEYAQLLFDAWLQQRHVFVFGNGGSAFSAWLRVRHYEREAIELRVGARTTWARFNGGLVPAM